MMRFQIWPEPGLAFILPLIEIHTKKPEVLQTDVFCNCGRALPRTPLGEITALPQILQIVLWGHFVALRGGTERKGQERGAEGQEGRGSSGDADSVAKLLPNRLNR